MEYWKLVWVFVVAFLFGGYQSEGCWEIEKAALLQLKPFFPHINDEGISWGKGNCCRWKGVECSTSTGRVTRLFLEYSSVEVYNTISQGWYLNISLFLPFHELKSLDLGNNYIAGFIDNQGSFMNNLEILDLSHNRLLGNNVLYILPKLNSLKNLKELHLSGNQIESLGSLFQRKRELRLAKLEVLDLSFNYFNNSIFSSLAALPHLKSLNLEKKLTISYDIMDDSVPSQGNERELKLMNLEELNLWGNVFNSSILSSLAMEESIDVRGLPALKNLEKLHLTGYIEKGWQNLTSLEELTLIDLSLTSNAVQDIGALTSLKDLVIDNCVVDDSFNLHGFCELRQLQTLAIINGKWNARLPECFSELISLKHLDLSFNNFSGDITMLKNLSSLEHLDLSYNNFSGEKHSLDTPTFRLRSITLSCCGDGGSFPQSLNHQHDLQYVDLSNINFKGDQFPNWLLENNGKLQKLNLANSSLSGHFQLPSTSHRGLIYLDNMSHLVTLDLSNNILSCGIPRWMGKMSDLEELVMANNHFEGPIPMEFCKLNRSLQFLDLSANNISGSLPSCFSSSILSHVYLSRNKLKGPITGFFNSSGLVTLDLSNNHLTGSIPNWIGTLFTLSYLLLNNNHFEGGIPIQLCKSFSADVPIEVTMKSISYFYKGRVLTYLSGIDLSCNKLTGEIPHQFQYLRDIIVLNFSHNSLIGPIPPALSDLSQIESLDLSYNYLSGNIPSQLLGLHFLSFFSVAYNNLSGTTPQRIGQFATFEESSYEGNPFLYGEPLPKNCSTDGSSSSMPKNATNEGFIDMKVFYASFVGSYIVMPLCIATVLYINPYWRRAWIYHVEAATMSCYYFVVDHILPKRFLSIDLREMEYWKLVWMFVVAFLFGGYQSEACWENEKAALFRLKPFFAHIDEVDISWAVGNCCRWNGVECSISTGRVTRLFLDNPVGSSYDQRYKGWYLNVSLFLPFVELKSLHLRGNYIAGFIHHQDLNVLSNLKKLNMSYDVMNDFIPSQVRSEQYMSYNILYGVWIGNERELKLMNLEELNLKGNVFNSSILSSLGSLSNLKSLSLSHIYAMEGLTVTYTVMGLPALKNLEKLRLGCVFGSGLINGIYASSLHQKTSTVAILQLQSLDIFPSLKTLSLTSFNISGTIIIRSFCELRQLQTLAIIYSDWNASLPDCFSELTSLNFLDLFSNKDISGLKNLTSLKYLDLSSNNFSEDISGLKNLISFEYLDFFSNNFSGDISGLKNLTSLEYLDLSNSNLSGDISHLKSLTSLPELRLWNNNIEIPSSLAPLFNLSKLQNIYADNNMIYNAETEMHSVDTPTFQLRSISLSCCGDGGSFPQSLNHQHDLQRVDLSNINFKGDQFPSWLLEKNKKLKILILVNSSLSGHFQLPSTSRRGLSELDVSNNSLDNIPNEIGAKLPSLKLFNISNNFFGGGIPISIGDMISLQLLDLSNNKLSGRIPRHFPMRLVLFSVSSNQLFGDIQSSMENMSLLKTLDLSNNALFGGIPRWMGKMSYLEELVMANNHFEGPIPMEFCKLNYSLIFLDLSANNISGTKRAHHHFFNRSSLVTLDLSDNHLTGNIPNWICTLSTLNHFEGGIPVQLCKLNWLRLMDISSNNLSRTIPPCLMITISNDSSHAYYANHFNYGDIGFFSSDVPMKFTMKSISYFYKGRVLTYLSGIDLSCNKLTGEIPHQFQHFRDIIILNFSHNSLIGPIPSALSDLSQIESLDLSHNNLSGNIPSQLLGLHFLSFFSVAYNNLSGTTPERTGQFATFEESSYVGNPFLCGEPLPKNCSTDGSSSSIPKNAIDEGFIDMKVFYASFVGSCIVMPLCIAIVLYINPYWRRAWFYHVEAATMSCYYFVLNNILPKRFY
ncbi:hypothetical protein CXB51_036300 [Gossypium anomalum]|uniref:Leucine-rich repeat-containing N-terminal plant-type domain-containing protein n=1 Tax=Gossypium anomalum TaxID=47600 RepID=A0A8J5XNL6_9ROSI|nr:hypothetical protein CXB51_036300 [Gossypium anomalum]